MIRLFERTFGAPPEAVRTVAADGSRREYYRLTGGPRESVIGAYGPDRDENRAFLSFSRTFREIGLPVPEIYAEDAPAQVWLLEDLGDQTLFAALTAARTAAGGAFPAAILPAYERVVDILPRFQIEGGRAIDFSLTHPRAAFDRLSMAWDLNYFKYHFLKLAHVSFHEERLEADFGTLIDFLLQAEGGHFLYRDFQSRNILLRGDDPWFIDYQSGRRGALQYDIASLLYDGRAALPESVRGALLSRYLDALSERIEVDRGRFESLYRGFVLIRIMQAMGAYGYRGFFERKPIFLESVPFAARNLALLLEQGLPSVLPELEAVFQRIVDRWGGAAQVGAVPGGPTLRLSSFSYRHGYPTDEGGHGGGFVFDCRSLPNPGRSPEFAELTGKDSEVVAFLEGSPEVQSFWEGMIPLVEGHIDRTRKRGFTDLSVAFGCTGGQHRSVYLVERLARHLGTRHPELQLRVDHREAPRWPVQRAEWTP